MPTCVRCGNIRFNSWVVYTSHMLEFHGVRVIESIKPVNKSGRTKAEIVSAVEITMDPHLLTPDKLDLHNHYLKPKV
jgi:hypothetical protein